MIKKNSVKVYNFNKIIKIFENNGAQDSLGEIVKDYFELLVETKQFTAEGACEHIGCTLYNYLDTKNLNLIPTSKDLRSRFSKFSFEIDDLILETNYKTMFNILNYVNKVVINEIEKEISDIKSK